MIKGVVSVLNNDYQISLPPSKVPTYRFGTSINNAGVGSVFRQVLNKMKKKKIISFDKLWVKTQVYSGGCNINVYLHNPTKETLKLVKNLGNTFMSGDFNPMIDLYEYDKNSLKLILENGEELDCTSKYVFVYGEPPWGSKEYEEMNLIGNTLNG